MTGSATSALYVISGRFLFCILPLPVAMPRQLKQNDL
jgi:hypothetical protein